MKLSDFTFEFDNYMRANEPSKRLSSAAIVLAEVLNYKLRKNELIPIYLSSNDLVKITGKTEKHSLRILEQLSNIFDVKRLNREESRQDVLKFFFGINLRGKIYEISLKESSEMPND